MIIYLKKKNFEYWEESTGIEPVYTDLQSK
jgi:hypothetical protein